MAPSLELIGFSPSASVPWRRSTTSSVTVRTGTVHALLGENGAGKSTLVKCVMGYYQADEANSCSAAANMRSHIPHDAHELGHRHGLPALHAGAEHDGRRELRAVARRPAGRDQLGPGAQALQRSSTACRSRAARRPGRRLSAGEKQKCEILKQLYLKRRLLILDEPTSVLTPDEADEVLGMLRTWCATATSPS